MIETTVYLDSGIIILSLFIISILFLIYISKRLKGRLKFTYALAGTMLYFMTNWLKGYALNPTILNTTHDIYPIYILSTTLYITSFLLVLLGMYYLFFSKKE